MNDTFVHITCGRPCVLHVLSLCNGQWFCSDGQTHTHRMLTVPEWLSIFPVQVKLPCNYLCQPFLRTVKILPFTFIEKGDSETIKYKTVPLKSGPSQLSSPETVTSKFQFDSHQYFICRYRQLQNTILGSRVQHWILLPSEPDVLLRLQTKEVQSPNLACRRLEGYRPVARRVLARDDTNRRKKPVCIGNRTHDLSVRAT